MAKSDLAARPIFHRQEESIKTHILICFTAVCVSKLMEIDTRISIKRVVEELKTVIDAQIRVNSTGETILAPGEITSEVKQVLDDLNLSH